MLYTLSLFAVARSSKSSVHNPPTVIPLLSVAALGCQVNTFILNDIRAPSEVTECHRVGRAMFTGNSALLCHFSMGCSSRGLLSVLRTQ